MSTRDPNEFKSKAHAKEEWQEIRRNPGIDWDERDLEELPPTDCELLEVIEATEGIMASAYCPIGSTDYGDHLSAELAKTGLTLADIEPKDWPREDFSDLPDDLKYMVTGNGRASRRTSAARSGYASIIHRPDVFE